MLEENNINWLYSPHPDLLLRGCRSLTHRPHSQRQGRFPWAECQAYHSRFKQWLARFLRGNPLIAKLPRLGRRAFEQHRQIARETLLNAAKGNCNI